MKTKKHNFIRTFLFFYLCLLISSCTSKESNNSKQIHQYYKGFKDSNYELIKKTISDSLTITAGDYTMIYTPKSFYNHFKWDSIFKPNYNLITLEELNEKITVTVSISSLRFKFLKNNPLTCKYRFHFNSGKIARIENLDCINVDWNIWTSKRDSLVQWTQLNHPNLDGFINDLSMKGANNYLKAIKLYENR